MKATKNMNIAEIKSATDKFTAKTPVSNNLQELQLNEYAESLKTAVQNGNDEALMQTIADIFNYGYMNGTKQAIKDAADKYDKHFSKSKEKSHRAFVELAYYMPYGICSDFLYGFTVSALNRWGHKDTAKLLPKKQRELFEMTRAKSKSDKTA